MTRVLQIEPGNRQAQALQEMIQKQKQKGKSSYNTERDTKTNAIAKHLAKQETVFKHMCALVHMHMCAIFAHVHKGVHVHIQVFVRVGVYGVHSCVNWWESACTTCVLCATMH